ncbi:MAG: hypothetical protein ACRD19_14700 [Terriglobia bacterium]
MKALPYALQGRGKRKKAAYALLSLTAGFWLASSAPLRFRFVVPLQLLIEFGFGNLNEHGRFELLERMDFRFWRLRLFHIAMMPLKIPAHAKYRRSRRGTQQ